MPWKLVAQAGMFIGGGIAGIVIAILTGFGGLDLGGDTVNNIDSGGGNVTVHVPAEAVECPDGWANTSDQDEHTVVLSCSKDNWIVYLNADKSFSHAWDQESPDFIFNEGDVPDWGE